MRTRVALAEDHKLVRARLRRILEADPRLELVAEAEDGKVALRQALELMPDVVVMDIRMPILNGIEATRVIRAWSERVRVLVVSLHCDEELARQALEAGATGIMLKEEANELVSATLLVAAGERFLSKKINAMLNGYEHTARQADQTVQRLDEPERQVLMMLARGASGGEIACELRVDDSVLAGHRRQILRKLSLHGASDLARLVDGQ